MSIYNLCLPGTTTKNVGLLLFCVCRDDIKKRWRILSVLSACPSQNRPQNPYKKFPFIYSRAASEETVQVTDRPKMKNCFARHARAKHVPHLRHDFDLPRNRFKGVIASICPSTILQSIVGQHNCTFAYTIFFRSLPQEIGCKNWKKA
jgi:hypothetical protein